VLEKASELRTKEFQSIIQVNILDVSNTCRPDLLYISKLEALNQNRFLYTFGLLFRGIGCWSAVAQRSNLGLVRSEKRCLPAWAVPRTKAAKMSCVID
jgi:hypothetical protein